MHQQIRDTLIEAGLASLRWFRKTAGTTKQDGSPVSKADLLSEEIICTSLRKLFPEMSIRSEEGHNHTGKDLIWHVDPLDGTAAFLEGLAYWGPSLGLSSKGEPLYGALYLPCLRDEFYAQKDQGAWLNHQRLPPMKDRELGGNSVLYAPSGLHSFARVIWPGKIRCLGSIAAHLCLTAAGCADAVLVPPGWQSWDVVAGLCMIRETQGVVQTATGSHLSLEQKEKLPFLAGTPTAVQWLTQPKHIQPF